MILANIHFARKENAKAEEEYKAAIQEVPKDNRPRIALGFLYQAQQRWEEAFGVFEAALQTEPENWNALYQVGKTAALSGQRLDRGEECLKKYLTYAQGRCAAARRSLVPARHGLREEGRQGRSARALR
jgi:tetratricopeptide (TPR) repeat protein